MLLVLGLTLVLVSLSYSSLMLRGHVVVKFATLLVGATTLLSLGAYLVAVGRRGRELRDPLILLLFAELGVMVYSVAFSGQVWVSLLGSTPRLMGAMTIACFVVAGLAVVLAVGERRERLLVLLRMVAGAAALSALNAIFEWPTHPELRPHGLVGNPLFLSNYLLFGALGGVGLVFVERRLGWAIFGVVTASLAAVAMSICQSRGAWLGYGLGVAALLLFAVPRHLPPDLVSRLRIRMALLLGATLMAALLVSLWGWAWAPRPIGHNVFLPFLPVGGVLFISLPWLLYPLRFVRQAVLGLLVAGVLVTGVSVKYQLPILPNKAAEALRITHVSPLGVARDDTTRMLGKHWLVGCGIENFRVAFLEYKSERLARFDPRVNYRNPFNMMYYEWATSGLPGVLVFLGLFGMSALWLLRARHRERASEWGLLATAVFATLAAYTLQSFFSYDVIPTGLHHYLFLGVAVALYRNAGRGAAPVAVNEDVAEVSSDSSDVASEGMVGLDEAGTARRDVQDADKADGTNGGAVRPASRSACSSPPSPRNEEREERLMRCARWMAIGLIGVTALYLLLHALPGLKDLFRFWTGTDAAPDRKDGLALLLLSVWAIAWVVAGMVQSKGNLRVTYLLIGLVGFTLGYAAFYLLPPTRDLLQGVPEEGASRVREDVLPGIFLVSWAGFWLVAAFSRAELDDRPLLHSDGVTLGRRSIVVLALLLGVFVGTGSWWAGRQLEADYHMYRAMAYSRLADGPAGQIRQIQAALSDIAESQEQHWQQGEDPQVQRYQERMKRLQDQQSQIARRLQTYLYKVRIHGRIAAERLDPLGYYHLQYSKALHPFLKAQFALPDRRALLEESLRHALRSVHQNTNPESAWSHLAAVWLAKRDLAKAKAALARSIRLDPYYYDTHRMMALLHLQDGHIDEAEREMHRSLDLTAGKHFHFSVTALQRFLAHTKKGDLAAADQARAEIWYWLNRGLSFPDLPIQLLYWWSLHDSSMTLHQVAASLTTGDGKPSAAALRKTRRRGFGGISSHHLVFYRALREILFGDPSAATSPLLGLHFGGVPLEEKLEAVINLLASTAELDADLDHLDRMEPPRGSRSAQVVRALSSMADRLLDREVALYRHLTRRLARLLGAGDTSGARRLASNAAMLLAKVHEAQLLDYFSVEFRQRYGQVLSARRQVMEATSPAGRLARADSFLGKGSPSTSLRISDEALARFPEGPAALHYVRAASLDALGRLDEALTAYDTYLRLAPSGERAEVARHRMRVIGGE